MKSQIEREPHINAKIDLSAFNKQILFAENPAVVIQTSEESAKYLSGKGVSIVEIGKADESDVLKIQCTNESLEFHVPTFRKHWMTTSFLMDKNQLNLTEILSC